MTATVEEIRTIEARARRGWQAPEETGYDGWLLRFAGGFTRRANSVNPVDASTLPLEDKIAHCEAVYGARSLPCIFRLHPAVADDLDGALARRGYLREAETAVLVCDLAHLAVVEVDEVRSFGEGLFPSVTAEWLHSITRWNGLSPGAASSLRGILDAIEPETAYLIVYEDGAPVAVGLGVVEAGWLGIFDVVVDPAHRRRGLGRRLVRHLMRWGAARGAVSAYLQVFADNEAAHRLYRDIGFTEVYRYWYRVPTA